MASLLKMTYLNRITHTHQSSFQKSRTVAKQASYRARRPHEAENASASDQIALASSTCQGESPLCVYFATVVCVSGGARSRLPSG